MNHKPRNWVPLLLAVFLVALIGCSLGCLIAIRLIASPAEPPSGDPHVWLHDQLGITESQKVKLEEIEERFERREDKLRAALAAANAHLADVILEEREYTPTVASSIEKIHKAMAELQKATVEHLFEMEDALSPEQFDLLLELAGTALNE